MNRLIFPLLFVCVLFSCNENDKSVDVPSNVLPKEKMAQVITAIHLAEAEYNLHSSPDTTLKAHVDFQKIFDRDTITKQQYEESLAFYIDHPEMLDKVYEQVLIDLSKMQSAKQRQGEGEWK